MFDTTSAKFVKQAEGREKQEDSSHAIDAHVRGTVLWLWSRQVYRGTAPARCELRRGISIRPNLRYTRPEERQTTARPLRTVGASLKFHPRITSHHTDRAYQPQPAQLT